MLLICALLRATCGDAAVAAVAFESLSETASTTHALAVKVVIDFEMLVAVPRAVNVVGDTSQEITPELV